MAETSPNPPVQPKPDTPVSANPASSDPGWPRFGAVFVAAALVTTALGAAVTLTVDPLWVFRRSPPWLAWTGGVNRHLDLEMRRAKPLQLLSRSPATIVVGSSVVYRGIDPSDIPGGGYNLGLSSLMADELPALAAIIAARGGVRRVVIGLDYFMFSAMAGPPPVDPRLAEPSGRIATWLGAAISLRALLGSTPSAMANAPEPGFWHYDGFKSTPDYPPGVTERIAAEQDFAGKPYRPESLSQLREALRRLAGVDTRIYLSPVSTAELAAIREAGRLPEFERWKTDVAGIAAAFRVDLYDLSRSHPFRDFDPRSGSSAAWLDSLHFKPVVGRWIVGEIGLGDPV